MFDTYMMYVASQKINEMLAQAKTFSDYNNIIKLIEKYYFIADAPFFSYSFPFSVDKKEWTRKLIPQFNLTSDMFERLILNGFIIAESKFLHELPYDPYTKILGKDDQILIDADYGILCNCQTGKVSSMAMDLDFYQKYFNTYPNLRNPVDLLEIGKILFYQINNLPYNKNHFTYHIKNRNALDELINFWNSKIKQHNLSIWYRGQTKEYFCSDLSSLAKNTKVKICPWRSIVDPALTPSLFRYNDIKDYAYKLSDLFRYHGVLNEFFKTCFMSKRTDAACKEKLPLRFIDVELSVSSYIDGKYVETHDYHHKYTELTRNLFSQHYGLESPILDLTSDIDIALFFAQNKIQNNSYVKIDAKKNKPIIYVFLFNNDIDPFLDSSFLMQDIKALRPLRQKCGVIMGASRLCKEFYSRFISFKIVLEDNIEYNPLYTQEYLFPSEDEDDFLKKLKQIRHEENIMYASPFEIVKDSKN